MVVGCQLSVFGHRREAAAQDGAVPVLTGAACGDFVRSAILTVLLGIMLIFGGRIVAELPAWIPDARPPEAPFGIFEFAGRLANLTGLILKIPFGAAIGIYGLWILLSEQGRTYHEARAAQSRA